MTTDVFVIRSPGSPEDYLQGFVMTKWLELDGGVNGHVIVQRDMLPELRDRLEQLLKPLG